MIDRRRFTIGLASLLAAGPARAAGAADDYVMPGSKGHVPGEDIPIEQIPNHRQLMRDIVMELAAYGKRRNPGFIILVRNAPELLIKERREADWEDARDPAGSAAGKYTPMGTVNSAYLNAIDGLLIDGLFYGQNGVDSPTDDAVTRYLTRAVDALRRGGRPVLTIEYCHDARVQAAAAKRAAEAKTLSFIDDEADKSLGRIPKGRPPQENPAHVIALGQVRNFLPMMQSAAFGSRADWVAALAASNYDLLLLDPFWHGTEALSKVDVDALKFKELGSRRLVLARLPVGRAAKSRYYWKADWHPGAPPWLVGSDTRNPGEMTVEYWAPEWKSMLGQYTQGVVDIGFDGVLLDAADAYLRFEDLQPID